MPTRPTVLLLATILLGACSNKPIITDTANGKLRGYVDEGVEHYLGVPYAQAPIGDLRWRPPQPAQPWEGLLEAQDNPPACLQFIPLKKSLVGSEDCLYLNVWVPAERPEQPLPVMVWLHGGGFILGKGSYSDNDGRELAAQGKVVVVSVDYRLGVFGFMAHPALNTEVAGHPGSGNYGIEDQTPTPHWASTKAAPYGGRCWTGMSCRCNLWTPSNPAVSTGYL